MANRHVERHAIARIGWLRAAVLGANDGIVSTASLLMGMAASGAGRPALLLAGIAGLAAGAMSMAAGEYVSVSSQSDSEKADLARERAELQTDAEFEHQELAQIYVARGLTPDLARQVADQMMAKDALAAHARDELGITDLTAARPLQAALTSAVMFSLGAGLPLLAAMLGPADAVQFVVAGASLASLAVLGAIGARAGRAPALAPVLRVTFWGAAAMAVTTAIGALAGAIV